MGDSTGSAPAEEGQGSVQGDDAEEPATSTEACAPSFQEFRAAILAALKKGDPTKAPSMRRHADAASSGRPKDESAPSGSKKHASPAP